MVGALIQKITMTYSCTHSSRERESMQSQGIGKWTVGVRLFRDTDMPHIHSYIT